MRDRSADPLATEGAGTVSGEGSSTPRDRGGPIVVGGLGGSGTRAIALGLEALGVYMGSHLTDAYDNRWFTLLCNRKGWLPQRLTGPRPSREIADALHVLEALMLGRSLDRAQLGMLAEAAAERAAQGPNRGSETKGPRVFRVAADALASSAPPSDWWGWKEPNSHLVLPELTAVFPGLHYIHVVRHPLDMAFSSNRHQMRRWGRVFGIEPGKDEAGLAEAQVRWWLRSTELALEAGRELGERFRMLRFEDLCEDPVRELRDICAAFGIQASDEGLGRAAADVKPPAGIGRWRQHPWERLDPKLVEAALEHGFEAPVRDQRPA